MDNRSSQTQSQHRRQPALGKSMPVTALLLNLDVTRRSHDERGVVPLLEDDEDEPPRYFDAPVDLQEPPSPGDSGSPDPAHYAEHPLLGNSRNDTPCLNCSQSGSSDPRSGTGGIINEMCQLLCNEQCRQQGLSLCGQQMRAQDAQQQQEQQEQLHAAFLKQYEIAEALAKTSAMTSTSQMKQRLAARKLEMEIETQAAAAAEAAGHGAARLATPRLEIDIDDAAVAAAAAAGDTVPPSVDHELPPPRDLLLYLVR